MRWNMARFCPLDQRLSPSEYARAADKMLMLSFANSNNTKTMTRNGQMICNRRPLPGRRANVLCSGFCPRRVPSIPIGLISQLLFWLWNALQGAQPSISSALPKPRPAQGSPARSITRSAGRADTEKLGMSVKPYTTRQVIPRWNAGMTGRSRSSLQSLVALATGLRNARGIHPDLVDAGARGDIQGLVVGVAELDVGDELRGQYRTQMLALR